MKYRSLYDIYSSFVRTSNAIFESGIKLYTGPKEVPDVIISLVHFKEKKGIIQINNEALIGYFNGYAEQLRNNGTLIVGEGELEKIIEILDKKLKVDVFRVETNLHKGKTTSEFVYAYIIDREKRKFHLL